MIDTLERQYAEYKITWDVRITVGVERVVTRSLTFADIHEAKAKVRELVENQENNHFYDNKIEDIRWSEREVFASPWNTRKV